MVAEQCIGWRTRSPATKGLGSALLLQGFSFFGWASSEHGGRNIKRNVLEKLMEYEEDGPVKDLDLTLPGRDALGLIL